MKEKIAVLSCLILVVLLYVMMTNAAIKVGYEINDLKKQRGELIVKYKVLLKDVGQLRSVERVERIAKTKLNMCIPGPCEVIVLSRQIENKDSEGVLESLSMLGGNIRNRIRKIFGGAVN